MVVVVVVEKDEEKGRWREKRVCVSLSFRIDEGCEKAFEER